MSFQQKEIYPGDILQLKRYKIFNKGSDVPLDILSEGSLLFVLQVFSGHVNVFVLCSKGIGYVMAESDDVI